MECKKCGTTYEGTFCPNCGKPANPTKEKKPIYKKWWFWLIAVVLVIAIFGNSGGGEDTSSNDDQGNTTTVSSNEDSNNTQSTTETQTSVSDNNRYKVGDVINANGLNITYVSAENWESNNQFMQPEDGYKYIRLKISAENKSTADRYISSFEFECYADGKKEAAAYIGDNTLDGGTLSAGRRTEGYIYFTVPTDAKVIEVEYETSFWTDKKAIFVVEIAN